MACSTKLFCFVVLLALLSLQTQARESQFFSKVTNNNYVKDPEFHSKEEVVNKQEEEPTFIPQTQTGYGLYGHETIEVSPTTTTPTPTTTTPTTFEPYTTTPQYKTQSEEPVNKYPKSYNTDHYNNNNNNYYNNENTFENTQNGRRTETRTRLAGSGYVANPNGYDNNNGGSYHVERQGMSDTRFMSGGKYYYDINSEKNYDQNQYGNSRVVDSKNNWYNNRGYYGNKNGGNLYDNNNSFEGYQNQEEFQENKEEFEP
ncbi:protein E6 [Ziziphus jujuba]|uniref:Protein E6 n=1 Tax=Ziziphus jujuba TaxID=326968 RepID=A0A6P4A9F7_ZIZJJ|nr:protein E6 [Ziziphus jujuba]